ncbi:hypothetical protein VTK73DRAFT_7080 [Phialemonium thermophilum]|uniref:Sm domain-containing protein n=1 Tax=Phialemonium thermophilum TaxID=223376 RepID=A0ABR3XUV4_9PEZI
MLPLGLLTAAQGHPMLVELKNGETLNGHLITCDTWMNLTLKEVVQTSPEGDKFMRLPEVYVKGNNRWDEPGEDGAAFSKYAYGRVKEGQGKDESITVKTLLRKEGLLSARGLSAELHAAPTPVIYEALRVLQTKSGQRRKLRALVEYLVGHRLEEPNSFLYEALIASNWDVAGSAVEVKNLLEEMKSLGVAGSAGLYHAALRAFAVHPDYLQRNTVLQTMRESWIELTPDGRYSVAVGLLRDGQYELALDNLDRMINDGIDVPSWLYDIFIYALGQRGFVGEAFSLLQRRLRTDDDGLKVPLNVWYFLLDECSRELHYEGTWFIWSRMVQSRTLVPSDGMCLHVLNTAARHGDAKLATQAVQQLSSRGVRLGMAHFESLIDCYCRNNDIENALQVLCIMANAGIQSDAGSTRSIYLAIKRTPALADVAADALFDLAAKYDIPISAFNVVIEGLSEKGDHTKAIDLYNQVRHLCPSGPNIQTFEILFKKCADLDTAQFLASEMTAFSLKRTQPIYDQLVYLAAVDGDLEVAFRYLWQAGWNEAKVVRRKSAETWIGRRTVVALIRRCFAIKDERLWSLLREAKERGLDLTGDIHPSLIIAMGEDGNDVRPKLSGSLHSADQQLSG